MSTQLMEPKYLTLWIWWSLKKQNIQKLEFKRQLVVRFLTLLLAQMRGGTDLQELLNLCMNMYFQNYH